MEGRTVKTKIAAAAVAVLLLSLVGVRVLAVTGAARRPGEAAPRPPLVPAVRVARGDVEQRVVVTGSIRARNAVVVRAELPGRIASLAARVGDAVRPGQVLATIDHDELAWQAKAARAAVEVARANADGARLEHARTKALHDGDAAPAAQLEAAGVRLALARAQLAQAEAAAGLADEQVRKARITAPIAGVVSRRSVEVGGQVAAGAEAFAIEDVAALKLESAVEAAEWASLAPGVPAEVAVDARPGETFPGKVTVRAPSLDPATRRATIEIEIENGAGKLLPGAFARATITATRIPDAVVLPREAVVDAPGGALVWRLADGKAHAVKPRLGAADARRVVVVDGLAEGELVATAGQASLADGGPAEAAIAPEGVRTASLDAPRAARDGR
jgi:membrane fusion protein (multidrug efflux system)